MAIRIGDMLVSSGLITQGQLDEALRAQEIFGGRLGTNLVELGYVSEIEVAKVLSKQLGIPCADASEFGELDDYLLSLVPASVVEAHKVVPLSADKRVLRLAMADPTNLKAIDELSFATGLKIEPVVSPEILITYAIEKYYGVARATRYLKLSGASESEFAIVQSVDSGGTASPGSGAVKVQDRSDFLDTERKDYAEKGYTLQQASLDLAAVEEQIDVFSIIKKFVSTDFDSLALFVLRGNTVVGWSQLGAQVDDEELRKISFPMSDSALFKQVCEDLTTHFGKPPASKIDQWVFQSLKFPVNQGALCLPILVNSRPVGVVLATGVKHGEVADVADPYSVFAKKISYALQILYLRKRILA